MPDDRSHLPEPAEATTASPAEIPSQPEWLQGLVNRRESDDSPQLLTGHLRAIDGEGRLVFQPEGRDDLFPVTIGLDASDGTLVQAVRRQRRALVMRTGDPVARWVLVGLVRDRIGEKARDAKPGRLEVTVDGEKVRLEAEHDIELKCGQASLTLRYDGRIELRGTHILSASRGPNRVKGATIALN
jgi:hypothetical protein